MDARLTDRQRELMEHVARARKEGVSLSVYARAQGIAARDLYSMISFLRKKGKLPSELQTVEAPFVTVKIERAASAVNGGGVCRIVFDKGVVIECCEWPSSAWLVELLKRSSDAAA